LSIYENTAIGNFIHMMGYIQGRIEEKNPDKRAVFASNLFQQTPMDSFFADYFCKISDLSVLIEFKRAQNRDNKETVKRERLITALKNEVEFVPLSRRGHWMAMVGNGESGKDMDWLKPYIDMTHTGFNFHNYITVFLGSAMESEHPTHLRIGLPSEGMSKYLGWLKSVNESSRSSGGAVIVASATKDGKLQYLALPDIQCLFMKKEKVVELIHKRTIAAEQELERELSRPSRGHGRGM
jgi:hypothetical protein